MSGRLQKAIGGLIGLLPARLLPTPTWPGAVAGWLDAITVSVENEDDLMERRRRLLVSVTHLERTLSSPSCRATLSGERRISFETDVPTLQKCSIDVVSEAAGSPWDSVVVSSLGAVGTYRTAFLVPEACLPVDKGAVVRNPNLHARLLAKALKSLALRMEIPHPGPLPSEEVARDVASLLMASGSPAEDEIGIFHPTVAGTATHALHHRTDAGSILRLDLRTDLAPMTIVTSGPLGHPLIMAGSSSVVCGSIPPAEVVRRMRRPGELGLSIYEGLVRRR